MFTGSKKILKQVYIMITYFAMLCDGTRLLLCHEKNIHVACHEKLGC